MSRNVSTTHFSIMPELLAKAKTKCKENGMTFSGLIQALLRAWLAGKIEV